MTKKPSFWFKIWQYVKAIASSLWRWLLRYPIAIPVTVLLVILAIIAVLGGHKFQIGGILGKLWGRKKPNNKRAVVPEKRVDKDGEPIQPGESDDKGYTQAPVKMNIKDPGIFSDSNTVVIIEDKKEIEIPLPRGVSNKDVREVVRISTKVYEVHNNDGGISVYELGDLISELGG